MANLLRELFRGEFIVDEPREDAVSVSTKRLGSLRKNQPISQRDDELGGDLLSEISQMLLEQERLEKIASELRQKDKKTDDELFMRFFRMALSVLDGFDRIDQMAMEMPPSEEVHNWLKTVAALHSRMTRLCDSFGLKAMDPVGRPVDLNQHEVVEVIRTDTIADETVVEVRQKGYTYGGKILRDARVVVAKNERR